MAEVIFNVSPLVSLFYPICIGKFLTDIMTASSMPYVRNARGSFGARWWRCLRLTDASWS